VPDWPRPDLPSAGDSQLISDWLTGPRSRALRRASIGLRRRVLEAGCGHGVVTAELQRRARGTVTCLDYDAAALRRTSEVDNSSVGEGHPWPDSSRGKNAAPAKGNTRVHNAARVAGDCRCLPFLSASFDLVFFQNVLLWVSPLQSAVGETVRVLEPGGALVAIEPDYGGMMEHPHLGLQELWLAGLSAAGADPQVGRKLPGACETAGLEVWVELVHLPQPAQPDAVRLLDDLSLTAGQRDTAQAIAHNLEHKDSQWSVFIHVPYFLIVASKP